VKINLLKETLQNVDEDAGPVVGMIVCLKASLCKKIPVTGQKVTLMFNTACDKLEPFLARFFIGITPCI